MNQNTEYQIFQPKILTNEALAKLQPIIDYYAEHGKLTTSEQVNLLKKYSGLDSFSKNAVFELLEILKDLHYMQQQGEEVEFGMHCCYKLLEMYVHHMPELLNSQELSSFEAPNGFIGSSPKPALCLPIHKAAEYGDIKALELMINIGGADVQALTETDGVSKFVYDARHFITGKHWKDYWGDTPLHIAARNGNVEAVEFLINKNANVNAINDQQQTVIHLDFGTPNRGEILEMVIESGQFIEINHQDRRGDTPLHKFANFGNLNDIKLLVENGADILLTNKWPDDSDPFAGTPIGNARCMLAQPDALEFLEAVGQSALQKQLADSEKKSEIHENLQISLPQYTGESFETPEELETIPDGQQDHDTIIGHDGA